jgi:hypothetical protein
MITFTVPDSRKQVGKPHDKLSRLYLVSHSTKPLPAGQHSYLLVGSLAASTITTLNTQRNGCNHAKCKGPGLQRKTN